MTFLLSSSALASITNATEDFDGTEQLSELANNTTNDLPASEPAQSSLPAVDNTTDENMLASPDTSTTQNPDLTIANDGLSPQSGSDTSTTQNQSLTVANDGHSPQTGSENDIVMEDAKSSTSASPEPRNDNDLPPWLTQMIGYLRGVSEDLAWQNLVTKFVAFEKGGPPQGVSYS